MRRTGFDATSNPSVAGWRKSSRSNPSGNCVELILLLVAGPRPPAAGALHTQRPDP